MKTIILDIAPRQTTILFQFIPVFLIKSKLYLGGFLSYSFIYSFMPVIALVSSIYFLKKINRTDLIPILLVHYICVVTTSSTFLASPHRYIAILTFPIVLSYVGSTSRIIRFFILLIAPPVIYFSNITSVCFLLFLCIIYLYESFYLNKKGKFITLPFLFYNLILFLIALYLLDNNLFEHIPFTLKLHDVSNKIKSSLNLIGVFYILFILSFILSLFKKKFFYLTLLIAMAFVFITPFLGINFEEHFHHSDSWKILSTPLTILLISILLICIYKNIYINSKALIPIFIMVSLIARINLNNSLLFKDDINKIVKFSHQNNGCVYVPNKDNEKLLNFNFHQNAPAISLIMQLLKQNIRSMVLLEDDQLLFPGINPCLSFNREHREYIIGSNHDLSLCYKYK